MYNKFDEAVYTVGGVESLLHLMELALFHANEDSQEINLADVSSACSVLHMVLRDAQEALVDEKTSKSTPAKR